MQSESMNPKSENGNRIYTPIVFVNSPISDLKEDAIGFKEQLDILKESIKNGAKMIGLIAGYGTGKSSLTELLCKEYVSQGNPLPIRINLWDSFSNNGSTPGQSNVISNLTKSFLYQLSNGYDPGFGQYINKMLGRNYGHLSFSVNNFRSFAISAIVAGICYTISKISTMSNTGIVEYLSPFTKGVLPFFRVAGPFFLLISIICLVFGLKNRNVVFSHWKSHDAQDIEINDVFNIYQEIIRKITPEDDKKQLVIIDDLDRINEKENVILFLQELYRFQNSIVSHQSNIIFLVSIKPEIELNGTDGVGFIYSKVFDTTLFLKPIHFDDYDAVLMKIINSCPAQKEALEQLIGLEIGSSLPESFKWIKKGDNLTVRDLKDRLNRAIAILVALKNKSYKDNSAAKFISCTAVAYLESQYPKDYYQLIKNEKGFAEFMRRSYTFVDNKAEEGEFAQLKASYAECFPGESYSDNFLEELCTMVFDGIFDDDYRMYFYTYPKGSHIKTTEEREICDCLLFPNQYTGSETFAEAVGKAYESGENETISQTLATLDAFPKIILEHDALFENAVSVSENKAYECFKKNVIENNSQTLDLSKYWNLLQRVKFYRRDVFLNKALKEISSCGDSNLIVQRRKHAVKGFKEKAIEIKKLFIGSSDLPQITKDEIEIIDNQVFALQLIDIEKISNSQTEYLCDLVNSTTWTGQPEMENLAAQVLHTLSRVSSSDELGNAVLQFLQTNMRYDDDLFKVVCDLNIEDALIVNYLNTLQAEKLSENYKVLINKKVMGDNLRENIVVELIKSDLFYLPIMFFVKKNNIEQLDSYLGNTDLVYEACNKINQTSPDIIIAFRGYCVFVKKKREYESLFMGEFPFITIEEYRKYESLENALRCINKAGIDGENASDFANLINERSYTSEESLQLFEYLFSTDTNAECIDDAQVVERIISGIDFQKLQIRKMPFVERNQWYETFENVYEPADSSEAIAFTEKIDCFIPVLEEKIQKWCESDTDAYVELIRKINEFTEVTLQWLGKNYINTPLSENLCKELYLNNDYQNYIIAESLRTNTLVWNETIPIDDYLEVYKNVSEMQELLTNHWAFLEAVQFCSEITTLPEDKLIPIFKVTQSEPFFEYIFNGQNNEALKRKYLQEIGKFKTEKDSIAFQKIICQGQNIGLVDTIELKSRISEQLWESNPYHKGQFTKAWKKYWKVRNPELIK